MRLMGVDARTSSTPGPDWALERSMGADSVWRAAPTLKPEAAFSRDMAADVGVASSFGTAAAITGATETVAS